MSRQRGNCFSPSNAQKEPLKMMGTPESTHGRTADWSIHWKSERWSVRPEDLPQETLKSDLQLEAESQMALVKGNTENEAIK